MEIRGQVWYGWRFNRPGAIGLLALSLNRMMSSSMKSAKHIELKDERTHVRQKVLKEFDCQRTLGVSPATPLPIACPANVIPRDKNGRPLFRNDGQVGNSSWHVDAECRGGGIAFDAQRKLSVNSRKVAADDPLTKKQSAKGPLFPSGNSFCSNTLPMYPVIAAPVICT